MAQQKLFVNRHLIRGPSSHRPRAQRWWSAITQPPTDANVNAQAGGQRKQHPKQQAKPPLPELAVDVGDPPGVLSVKSHSLHLVLEPGSHVFAYIT